eukprot:1713098-Prymnesium_polylepis.1
MEEADVELERLVRLGHQLVRERHVDRQPVHQRTVLRLEVPRVGDPFEGVEAKAFVLFGAELQQLARHSYEDAAAAQVAQVARVRVRHQQLRPRLADPLEPRDVSVCRRRRTALLHRAPPRAKEELHVGLEGRNACEHLGEVQRLVRPALAGAALRGALQSDIDVVQ